MKHLVKLALSLHNPEENFDKSDYYPFIQKLFKDDLYSLKDNITILSYNYDCYLDFLLLKAQTTRSDLVGNSKPITHIQNDLSSGFYDLQDTNRLNSSDNHFRHLKLHGSMAYANNDPHEQLFKKDVTNRIRQFESVQWKASVPPIVFPWELFNDDGKFIRASDFVFIKHATESKAQSDANLLYNLFFKIWEGARRAVQKAEKISFVGMCMHSYLNQGLQFLFKDKRGRAQVIVANKTNEEYRDMNSISNFQPGSPRDRVAEVLRTCAPEMEFVRSSLERTPNMNDYEAKKEDRKSEEITARYSFRDFIEKEME